jgi:hypothetical protein
MVKYGKDKKMDPADAKALLGHVLPTGDYTMDAKQIFEAFKAAKADSSMTNGQIFTRHNQLYEKQRLAAKAAEIQKQAEAAMAEKDAEIVKLRAELAGKGKAAKAA